MKLTNFEFMHSKRVNTIVALFLTFAMLLHSTGPVLGTFNIKSLQSIGVDFEGDFELEDVEIQKDKISSNGGSSPRLFGLVAECTEHQTLYSYIYFLEIPSPPPDCA